VFGTLFWSSYQHMWSPLYISLNLWVVMICVNSCELSLKNTNLLSNSGIIFGYHYIIGSWLCMLLGYMWSLLFLEGQLCEFVLVWVNMNDTLIGWVLYVIDGCHLYHIVVGNMLLCMMCNIVSGSVYMWICCVCLIRYGVHIKWYNLQLVYWHFVELLWLCIYYVLYS